MLIKYEFMLETFVAVDWNHGKRNISIVSVSLVDYSLVKALILGLQY